MSLKRIEDRHLPYGDHPGCPEYQQLGEPCDIVKLARALEEFTKDGSPARHQRLQKEADRVGVPDLLDKIPTEEDASTEEEVAEFLAKVGHPVVSLDPMF